MGMADDEKPPRVLIAGADDPLAEALTASFIAAGRVVRLTHEEPLGWVDEGGPHIQFFESRLQDEVATDVLVRDMAAAVLLPRRGTSQHDWLDYDTREIVILSRFVALSVSLTLSIAHCRDVLQSPQGPAGPE